jgi:hypothetical protein
MYNTSLKMHDKISGHYFDMAIFLLLTLCRSSTCLDMPSEKSPEDKRHCKVDAPSFKVYVTGEESIPPMTSSSKQALVPPEAATWIRNTTVLLFSDHGGLVKDSAQELLHAGFPRENIFCVVSRYYAHVLQSEYALDADLCTPPSWAGAALHFLNRDFPRRHAEYASDRETRMRWTVLEDPAFLRAFADRFCASIAAFDIVWCAGRPGCCCGIHAPHHHHHHDSGLSKSHVETAARRGRLRRCSRSNRQPRIGVAPCSAGASSCWFAEIILLVR